MKKFVAVLLAAVLCLSFAACGGDKATDKTVDAAAMFQALLTDVTYTDNATELDSSTPAMLLSSSVALSGALDGEGPMHCWRQWPVRADGLLRKYHLPNGR